MFETIAAAPSHPVLWQQHFATRSPAANRPPAYFANLAAEPTWASHSTPPYGRTGELR